MCWMCVRLSVPSALRTEESSSAIGKYFRAELALPSASHHPASQRLHQFTDLRTQKCDFAQIGYTADKVFEVLSVYLQNSHK